MSPMSGDTRLPSPGFGITLQVAYMIFHQRCNGRTQFPSTKITQTVSRRHTIDGQDEFLRRAILGWIVPLAQVSEVVLKEVEGNIQPLESSVSHHLYLTSQKGDLC